MSNVIQFSGLFNKNYAPYLGQPQLMYALLELQPGPAVANVRLPLNFCLVLDRSGSMSGEKIRQLRSAVKWIIDQLQPNDLISIVSFNSVAKVLVSATPATDPGRLHHEVGRLDADGGTNIGPAIRAGLDEIGRHHSRDKVSRIILLTDGDTTGEEECRRQADAAGQMGVPIVALGLGQDWKEALLEDWANRSGQLGYADLIKRPEDVAPVFQQVFSRMQVVAQDLLVRLLMVQGVEARRVWQVSPLIKDVSSSAVQGRAIAVDIGELEQAGAAILIELLIPGRPPGRYRLAQAEASYNVPALGLTYQKEQIDMMVELTTDPYAAQQVNGRVMNIVEKVTAFRLQTQALDEAAMGNIASATRKLRAAHTRLLDQGEADLAQAVLQEAERLEQGQGLSNEGKKTIKLQSRKTVRLSDADLPS
jgi:Ca-activated chloride channel family protein